jgi:hypothetical protein
VAELRAGPIRLKFQDGELRYLYVGDDEILRRVYFAVRDKVFDTVMPRFSVIDVAPREGGFTARLEAECKGPTAEYRWKGEITGSPEGRIEFRVAGQGVSPFQSPRIGINLLLGTDDLAGQPFECVDAKTNGLSGTFPKDVSPALLAEANQREVRYVTRSGVKVACRVEGGVFGIEDQRNFCDSSYKAYHNLGYPRDVPVGEERSAALVIEATVGKPAPAVAGPVRVTLGKLRKGCPMPRFEPAEKTRKGAAFVGQNGKREGWKAATNLVWAFNPAAHMPDEDTYMENVTALADQVRTARALAPRGVPVRIDPLTFDSPYPRPARDARNASLFGAAWCAAMAGRLAEANVEEAVFTVGPGVTSEIQGALVRASGRPQIAVAVTGPRPAAVEAFAVSEDEARVLWLVNATPQCQPVLLEKLPKRAALTVNRLNTAALRQPEQAESSATASAQGRAELELAPYEVCQVTVPR